MNSNSSSAPAALEAWTQRSRRLADLLSRTGLGDRAAFAELYRQSSAQLLAVVLRIQSDRGQAEELLQEVYLKVWRHAGSFDAAQAQPMTWLTSIARNRAIDSLRRAQTQPRTVSVVAAADADEGDEGEVLERMADDADGPAELLDRASEARQLHDCLQQLSASQRQSVALAFYDGLSHAEVAEHLRQPLGTIKSWVRRGLQSLRGCLDRAARQESGRNAIEGV